MAAYIITTRTERGTPEDVAALVETYLETIDSTNQPVLSIGWMGDNNFVTAIIVHEDIA